MPESDHARAPLIGVVVPVRLADVLVAALVDVGDSVAKDSIRRVLMSVTSLPWLLSMPSCLSTMNPARNAKLS